MEITQRTKVLATLIVIALITLVVMLDVRRRTVEQQLTQLTVRLDQLTGNQQKNREEAKRVVEKVRRHLLLPADVEPTVATIVDVKALRQRNAFYNKAENGDNLIVTQDRAILYDPDRDIILDIVPVQIQATTPPAGAPK